MQAMTGVDVCLDVDESSKRGEVSWLNSERIVLMLKLGSKLRHTFTLIRSAPQISLRL